MNELVDIKIVECNRQSSNELRTDNKENNSSWRNNLTDVIHLEAGDKVSVYSSFISVDGAGQSNTMDIKGKSLGVIQTLFDTTITSTAITDSASTNFNIAESSKEEVLNRYRKVTATPPATGIINIDPVGTNFEVKDNEVNIVVSYYKNMDLDGYVQLPRRFVLDNPWEAAGTGDFNGWSKPRFDIPTQGRCLSNPWACYMDSDYKYYRTASGNPLDNCLKLRNDGSRYTLMIRNVAHFKLGTGNNVLERSAYQQGGSAHSVDPENAYYYQYKEIKKLSIPQGFNSANYVAEELSRQLQEIETNTTFSYKKKGVHEAVYKTYEDITTTKILESNTYKAFNSGSIDNYEKLGFDALFTPPAVSTEINKGLQAGYVQNYQYIAMKRPDLYEIGQRLNTIQGRQMKTSITRQTGSSARPNIIHTDLPYTDENLQLLKDFFDIQSKYPEIWSDDNLRTAETETDFYVGKGININNSRYLHMNRQEGEFYITSNMTTRDDINLGFSYYEQTTDIPPPAVDGKYNELKDTLSSQVIFTFFDPLQKEIYYDNPSTERGELTYGFASKDPQFTEGGIPTINLHPNMLREPNGTIIQPVKYNPDGTPIRENNGTIINLPRILYTSGGGAPGTGVDIEASRKWGFDFHFSAYGNAAIMLWTGRSKINAGADINRSMKFRQTTTLSPEQNGPVTETPAQSPLNTAINTKTYIGSDASKIGYDGTHFFFSNFHTPKNVGTTSGAGSSLVLTDVSPPPFADLEDFVNSAQNVVYKMNVKDDFVQYSPVRIPYEPKQAFPVPAPNVDPNYLYQQPNINQEYYAIFDSICGLTIEDFGIAEEQWADSLWGLMGFTYEQLHSNNNVRTERIGSNNSNDLNLMTTNAEVPIGDSKIFNQNSFGQSTFNNQLTQPICYVQDVNLLHLLYPTIQQATISLKIIAQDFPVSMARGYYSIRSDIINQSNFLGGRKENTILPIVAVVDKMNPQGDFYFGTESSLQFTMTGNRVLSSVSVSVHDPDGSIANTSEYSSVLFKIEKRRKLTYNIAQEILLDEEQKKKK